MTIIIIKQPQKYNFECISSTTNLYIILPTVGYVGNYQHLINNQECRDSTEAKLIPLNTSTSPTPGVRLC